MPASLKLYRILSFILIPLALLFAFIDIAFLMTAFANPSVLIFVFAIACLVMYVFSSFAFLKRGIEKEQHQPAKLKDWIKVNAYVSLFLCSLFFLNGTSVLMSSDMVLNGNEIGGGSIRIFQRNLQEKMFAALGMSPEEAQHKFGFLLGAFEYGAPPHGGIAFGFDRLCALLGGSESIRDFIAFPKNNSGRDVMLDAPSAIDQKQFEELQIKLNLK
ncbi:MAG: hypothetical protein RJB16_418 [Bacteroidota bacterium]